MSEKHNNEVSPFLKELQERERIAKMSDYEPINQDEGESPDNPWVVKTEGGFADSRELLTRRKLDEIIGGDSTLRENRKTLSERMKKMSHTERYMQPAIEDANDKPEIDSEGLIDAHRTTVQLDSNKKSLKRIERKLKTALEKQNVSLEHLKNLAESLESIRIPGVLEEYGDEDTKEGIRNLNHQRLEQIKLASELQSILDEEILQRDEEFGRKMSEKRITDGTKFLKHNNSVISEIENEINGLSGGVNIDDPRKLELSLRIPNKDIRRFIARLEGIKIPGRVIGSGDFNASQFVNKERENQLAKINHLIMALENALQERIARLERKKQNWGRPKAA
jgi:hypothetical protein